MCILRMCGIRGSGSFCTAWKGRLKTPPVQTRYKYVYVRIYSRYRLQKHTKTTNNSFIDTCLYIVHTRTCIRINRHRLKERFNKLSKILRFCSILCFFFKIPFSMIQYTYVSNHIFNLPDLHMCINNLETLLYKTKKHLGIIDKLI